MALNFSRADVFRADPNEEVAPEEDQTDSAGGGGDRSTPSREEAARRVAERENRRRTETQDAQEQERIRQEAEENRRFRQEVEPDLKLLRRLKGAFGDRREGETGDEPEPPDPYDPNWAQRSREWLKASLQRERKTILEEAKRTLDAEQQQRSAEEHDAARKRANDDLVESFFNKDRRDWPQQKQSDLLMYAARRIVPTGKYGEYVEADLLDAERLLYADEVAARAEARGANKIMDHLGAPRKPRTAAVGKLSPEEIDARAMEVYDRFERMSQRRQVQELERMQTEEPEVYEYFIRAIEEAQEPE